MAGNNSNLGAAKRAKNDEFYTQLTDIEKELRHYRGHFKDKTVLCNCDDPFESNFFKFFALNFKRLGLKKLIATCYEGSAVAEYRGGKATGESAIKPEYVGSGLLVLEPTYRYLLLMDASEWPGGVVLDDGLFLACESTLRHSTVMRSNFSSAIAGGEGLFNLKLDGKGVFCIEADCPREELIEINMQDDVLKVDGNFAVAWSAGLDFTVERSGKTLLGSAASGEGLVNVYRGTGRVLMMPVRGSRLSFPTVE